jgi:hypothetical protein
MKTLIYISGVIYYLWIKGDSDKDGNYQQWLPTWESGDCLNLAFHITAEDDKDADRVSFQGEDIVLLPSDARGAVFGYIWCTKEAMQPKGPYKHGLVGMRYGWEKAAESVFRHKDNLEFSWKRAVSETIWEHMNRGDWKNKAPAGMHRAPDAHLEEHPELFKKKISTLTFREKLMRFRRKSTVAVYEAIIQEFESFDGTRKLEVVKTLEAANFQGEDMVQLVQDLYDIGRKEDVIRQNGGYINTGDQIPAGL